MPAIVNKDVVRQFFRDIADNTNLAAAEDIIAPTYVGNFIRGAGADGSRGCAALYGHVPRRVPRCHAHHRGPDR